MIAAGSGGKHGRRSGRTSSPGSIPEAEATRSVGASRLPKNCSPPECHPRNRNKLSLRPRASSGTGHSNPADQRRALGVGASRRFAIIRSKCFSGTRRRAGAANSGTHRGRAPSNISAYVFRHHENNGDLQQALHSRKPDVDSVDADNPFTVRLRPAKFPPDAHAIRQ